MSELKLGKRPAEPSPKDLRFADYVIRPKVKQAPKGFGHHPMVQRPWGMLKNDELGDCEIARQLHATMLANATAGNQVEFTDQEAVRVYSAVTGYVPGDPSTDNGTYMRDCLSFARKHGVVDSAGVNHKIGAYLSIDPKDTALLLRALWLCDQVAIGFEVPQSAMDQFGQGRPWTVVPGSPTIGGHAIEVVARPAAEGLTAVTWGRLQRLSFGFYRAYNDEAWAVISPEAIAGGHTLEGFDLAALETDLASLS